MPRLLRPTWAEVDLDSFKHNLQTAASIAASAKLLVVVKANAYGIGAVQASKVALTVRKVLGVAVSTPEEALELRSAGINCFMLVLGQVSQEAACCLAKDSVALTVGNKKDIMAAQAAAETVNRRVSVHLKVDTGMERIGFQEGPQLEEGLQLLLGCSRLRLDGVFTHLASADTDSSFTLKQLTRFTSAQKQTEKAGAQPRYYHAANSAAVYLYPQSHFGLVRPGLMLYGCYPTRALQNTNSLRPVLSLYSRIAHVKEVAQNTGVGYGRTYFTDQPSTVVTVPIGYADGYPRLLSNAAHVLINGTRLPVVGRVCMDQLMVNAGDLPVHEGDLVTLIGRDGAEEITVDELAEKAMTIPHEILTGLTARVPRLYR